MFLAVPELALALERRASEGGRVASDKKAIDPASQILLAEEIIRLSEHLRSIATVAPTSPEETTSNAHNASCAKTAPAERGQKKVLLGGRSKLAKSTLVQEVEKDVNEISEKLSSIARQRKLNGTTFNGSRNFEKYSSSSINDTTSNFFTLRRSTKTSSNGASTGSSSCSRSSTVTTTVSSSSSSSSSGSTSKASTTSTSDTMKNSTDDEIAWPGTRRIREIDLTPPWRQSARVKRRFGETCRDVPRIATLQDLHKNMNLNEPASTKNLLLQLIDEWSEVRRPGGLGGRKSISLDWCGEDSIARKSINSLAEYFQSEQQKVSTAAAGTASSIR